MKKNSDKSVQKTTGSEAVNEPIAQDAIQRRAYELWEAAGRPHDCDLAHWLEAELQIKAQQGSKDQPRS